MRDLVKLYMVRVDLAEATRKVPIVSQKEPEIRRQVVEIEKSFKNVD